MPGDTDDSACLNDAAAVGATAALDRIGAAPAGSAPDGPDTGVVAAGAGFTGAAAIRALVATGRPVMPRPLQDSCQPATHRRLA
ncbi:MULTISPECIES: hypothetical protein [unclassified Acidiphilium]|uniref:hypothetical protein n=1 Tax=unclassified Acidiphilium TaxID=2617493 RepID=UPI002580DBBF|nr:MULTISPECIES: hypothetical protein [unclassified Acidiphilium]HQT85346.1 hypothetical protein [Acidiphilium rubrum]